MTDWITLIEKVRSIAQIGGAYTKDPYDKERYDDLTSVAHEMYSNISNSEIAEIEDFFIPEKGYATAKVDLRGGIFKEGKILLVRETRDGRWALPGGWADVGETPTEGVAREVKEETGFNIEVTRLTAIRDQSIGGYKPRYPVHVYKLFFLCSITGGEACPSTETSEIKFFSLSDLPELSVGTTLERDILALQQADQDQSSLVSVD